MRAYPAFAGFYGRKKPSSASSGSSATQLQRSGRGASRFSILLGPVGGGKSSLAERLKSLWEVHPIYVLKAADDSVQCSRGPLSLFDPESWGPMIEEKYGIPRRRLPWADESLVLQAA